MNTNHFFFSFTSGITLAIVMSFTSCTPSQFDGSNSSRRDPQGANSKKPTPPVVNQRQPTTPNPTGSPTPPIPSLPPAQNQDADCYKASAFVCKIERLITVKTNAYRATQGRLPLTYDSKMAYVARDWSTKQGQSGDISHSGFPETRSSVYQQEFKINRDFFAENVAMSGGEDSSQTDAAAESIAQTFATMWWNSAGHRANMLGDYSHLGMGMAQAQDGSWYGTQIFD